MATLSVVATPIGNLKDITLRALEVLKSADTVLAEDTRVALKLLRHYEITVPVISYHSHSTERENERALNLLREGKNIALITDAGTPGISDPGSEFISKVREELPDVRIDAIPGASALTSALSIAGVPSATFVFLGFLPHKKGRQTLIKEIANTERAVVLYESPHRIIKLLEELKAAHIERKVVVLRELTKMYEEVISGTPPELLSHFELHKDTIRGEFVVIVSPW